MLHWEWNSNCLNFCICSAVTSTQPSGRGSHASTGSGSEQAVESQPEQLHKPSLGWIGNHRMSWGGTASIGCVGSLSTGTGVQSSLRRYQKWDGLNWGRRGFCCIQYMTFLIVVLPGVDKSMDPDIKNKDLKFKVASIWYTRAFQIYWLMITWK